MLEHLARFREGRSRRVSSWDRSGGNRDAFPIEPGETLQLANIEGAGVIRHLWVTIASHEAHYPRRPVFRAYWDGIAHPPVAPPLGARIATGTTRLTINSGLRTDTSFGVDASSRASPTTPSTE